MTHRRFFLYAHDSTIGFPSGPFVTPAATPNRSKYPLFDLRSCPIDHQASINSYTGRAFSTPLVLISAGAAPPPHLSNHPLAPAGDHLDRISYCWCTPDRHYFESFVVPKIQNHHNFLHKPQKQYKITPKNDKLRHKIHAQRKITPRSKKHPYSQIGVIFHGKITFNTALTFIMLIWLYSIHGRSVEGASKEGRSLSSHSTGC